MYPQLSLLVPNCTRSLDSAVTKARADYATERTDFHTFFPRTTVPQMQRLLQAPLSAETRTPRAVLVALLLRAQQKSPHPLWTLLLVQAFDAMLVRRRRAISLHEDPAVDGFVLQSFVGSLDYIPESVLEQDLRTYVVERSRRALAPTVPVPAESGVRRIGEADADEPAVDSWGLE